MKAKLLLLTFLLGASSVASAYQHLWLGAASGSWNLGQNWTNGVPSSTENRALKLLFIDDESDGGMIRNTRQDIPGLVVDYMEVRGPFHFAGGFNRKLSFRDTNGASSQSVTMYLQHAPVFEDDLEIGLTMPVAVWSASTSIPNGVSAYFNGPITGPGEFRYYGDGRIEFGGDRANTFTGPLTVADGLLRLNKDGAAAVPGHLILGFGAPSGVNGSVLCLRPNQFAPGATATIYSDGRLDIDDFAQTISGLTFDGGRVTGGAGVLTLNGPVVANPADAPSRLEGQAFLGFVPRTFTVGGKYTNEGLHVSARISGASGATLIKNGPGTLTLAGTNVYSGGTVINQGTLLATGPSPLGGTNAGTTVNAGATLHLELTDLGDEPLTLSGQGVDDLGALFVFGSTTGAGSVTLPAAADITVWPTHTLRLNGVISGPGGLNLSSGEVDFGGDGANTYTGTTHVSSTTLELRKHIVILSGSVGLTAVPGPLEIGSGIATVRLFYDNQIANTSPVTLSGQGLLDLNGNNDTIGSLAGSGTVTLGAGELTIGGNGNSTTSAAVISGTGGRLRKIGPGTLTLTAAHNFTGGTFIEGGALVVNGTNGSVTVKTNGTLGGTGLVGPLTVQGGEVSPGVGAGRLNTKSVSFSSASSLHIELNGGNPGVSHDQLKVVGTVNLGGSALVLSLGFPGAVGSGFIILDNDGADAITGAFAGKPEGSTFSAGGATFQITYHGGDGNDVVLTQLTASTQDFAPVLKIESLGVNQVRLLWTTSAVGFHAEWASSLISSNWLTVPGVPSILANQFTLTASANTNAAFFRLVRP